MAIGEGFAHHDIAAGAHDGAAEGPRYRWFVLAILVVVYILNFMDRWIITILLQPIKEELHLADWELGLLNGFAFAILSSTAGLKLARMAERGNRVTILSVCIVAWSILTACCGLAGTFWQLLLARMGVGIGEAGGMPASHSLLADYFPPDRRAIAHAIYGLGLPIGGLLGMVIGGILVDHSGWRSAFLVVGLPGILIALLVRLMLREPPRGRYDPPALADATPSFGAVARGIWQRPTSRHIVIGLTLAVLIGNSGTSFLAPYLLRRFDLSYTEVALLVGATNFVTAAISTVVAGIIADTLGRNDRRWYMWVPAIGIVLAIPLNLAAYAQDDWIGLALFLAPAGLLVATYMAPSFATLHNLAQPRARATTSAIVALCMGLIGASIGPLLGGLTIDLLAEHYFAARGLAGFASACPGGLAPADASAAIAAACGPVLARATQMSLLAWAPLMLWPAIHFWIASRHIATER